MRPLRTAFAASAAALFAVLASPTPDAGAAEPGCGRWAIEAVCSVNPSRLIVSDPFTATLSVRNTGDMPLTGVSIALKGELGAHGVGGAPSVLTEKVETLAPGESKTVTATFASDIVGKARITGGARDAAGFAASNCYCDIEIIGLPAVQSEMTDKDLAGAEKGVFLVGEEFLYVLEVQNDGGSTVTSDLRVAFTLPTELAFVSGTGDRGVTVTGTEGSQTATTSTFVLAPNQAVKMTLRVRATVRPPGNLVQTKASIETMGGVAVAEESESTTIK